MHSAKLVIEGYKCPRTSYSSFLKASYSGKPISLVIHGSAECALDIAFFATGLSIARCILQAGGLLNISWQLDSFIYRLKYQSIAAFITLSECN